MKRYRQNPYEEDDEYLVDGELYEDKDGEWVKYEDVKKELHDLRQMAQDNAEWFDQLKTDYDKLQKQNKELLNFLIKMYDDWKYVDYYYKAVKNISEKTTGKT